MVNTVHRSKIWKISSCEGLGGVTGHGPRMAPQMRTGGTHSRVARRRQRLIQACVKCGYMDHRLGGIENTARGRVREKGCEGKVRSATMSHSTFQKFECCVTSCTNMSLSQSAHPHRLDRDRGIRFLSNDGCEQVTLMSHGVTHRDACSFPGPSTRDPV
jgi:hypothetical protein